MDAATRRRLAGRGCLDHDMFTDEAGRIYFVLGHYQPTSRVIASLKYVPDPAGTWVQAGTGTRLARSYRHQGIEAFECCDAVARRQPGNPLAPWFIEDPVFNTSFLEVPFDGIDTYLFPEDRLDAIVSQPRDGLDTAEQVTRDVATALLGLDGVPGLDRGTLGITGSILWRGHSDRSDVNMNVYGLDACTRVHKALSALACKSREPVPIDHGNSVYLKGFDDDPRVDGSRLRDPRALHRKPKLVANGFAPGIQLRWCLHRGEFPLQHGDEIYHDSGLATVTVEVIDDTFASFLPALVRVAPVSPEPGHERLDRLLVFDSRLVRLFQTGDVVSITGLLQRVEPAGTLQVLLGSRTFAAAERVAFIDSGGMP